MAPVINMIRIYGLELARISMVIHFGINPDRGGSPPRDRRSNGIII